MDSHSKLAEGPDTQAGMGLRVQEIRWWLSFDKGGEIRMVAKRKWGPKDKKVGNSNSPHGARTIVC